MLGVSHTCRVAWRRRHASRHYVGYVLVTDDLVRLAGVEQDTQIQSVLTIPPAAIEGARVGTEPDEQVGGEPAVIMELTDEDPIYLRPITTGSLELNELARRIGAISSRTSVAASAV